MSKFCGWIMASKEDQLLLETLGVELGYYDEQFEGFEECHVRAEALANLEPYWGMFIWCFKPAVNILPQQQNAA